MRRPANPSGPKRLAKFGNAIPIRRSSRMRIFISTSTCHLATVAASATESTGASRARRPDAIPSAATPPTDVPTTLSRAVSPLVGRR